jgi:CotH kinase protein
MKILRGGKIQRHYLSKWTLMFFFGIALLGSFHCKKKEEIIDFKPPIVVISGISLPHIDIKTNGGAAINSKTTYIPATISIIGQKKYSDYKGTAQIRGRGNSTWTFPKKPYRFKLDIKDSLFGLAAEKDWVLLANYLDGTHMLNAVAMKIGKLMDMPFTNSIIPVEVTLNGSYQGTYMLTEQVEVKKNRINIGDDGLLLLLDINYDEPWKFKSAAFQLPVQIKHPELTSQTEVSPIQKQFDLLDSLVARSDFPNNNYLDYFDAEAMANYFIVYMLTANEEINHPKSTYIYKTKTGKFTMGPIWDFDWAYGYEKSLVYFSSFNKPMFWSYSSVGEKFFSRFLLDPKIKTLIKQQWKGFKNNKFNELLTFVDEYSILIEGARSRDYQIWKRGNFDFKGDVVTLKKWLQNRAGFMDTYIGNL